MDLRVTMNSMINRALAQNRRQSDKLAVLYQQAQTGNRLLQPSDNPVDAVAILANKSQDERLATYLNNISDARASLEVGVSTLTEAGHIIAKARDLAIQGAHSGVDPIAYQGLATEVDALLDRLVDLANTKHQEHYIFGGTAVTTTPFVRDAVTQTITYQGALQRSEATININNQTVDTFNIGAEVFMARQRQTAVYDGPTGAAPGTGTDSATGQGTLQVRHTLTTFAPGSGVAAGTSSVSGDTIIGPAATHQLTIVDTSGTGVGGTVSLNGGPAIAFTNANTDLKVTGPKGEAVFLNTTAITAGFNGTVNLTGDGTLSIDGGATTSAINFSSNQTLIHSTTQAVTNVDSSNIRLAGDEHVEYPGSYDAFQILAALRDDLRNTRGLNDGEQAAGVANRLTELDRVRENIMQMVGEKAANLQNLEGVEARIQDVQLETRKLNGELESVDMAELILTLQEQQNLFRMSLASSAQLFDLNLLSFLR